MKQRQQTTVAQQGAVVTRDIAAHPAGTQPNAVTP
jgi:hypothetical protein